MKLKLTPIYLCLAALLSLSNSMQAQTKLQHRENALYLRAYLEFAAQLPTDYFLTDCLSSVIHFQVTTDENGIIAERKIIEPITHWGHARHVFNVLANITSVPSIGEKQVITGSVNYDKLVPNRYKRKVKKIKTVVQPSYNNKELADEFLCDIFDKEQRINAVANGQSQVSMRIMHKADASVVNVSLVDANTKAIIKLFNPLELRKATSKWTAPIVNGEIHDYYKSYHIDLRSTLSDEDLAQVDKLLKSELKEDKVLPDVLPKLNGYELGYYRSWLLDTLQKELRKKYGRKWYADLNGELIMSFTINEKGDLIIDDVENIPYAAELSETLSSSTTSTSIFGTTVTQDQYVDDLIIKLIKEVMSTPKWTPAMHNGKPVSIQYKLPLKFVRDK